MRDTNNNRDTEERYEVVEIEGKGKGVIAKEDLESGTLLMIDTALIEIQHDYMLKERVARSVWSPWETILSLLEVVLIGVMITDKKLSMKPVNCSM